MATGLVEGAVLGAAVQEGVKPVTGLISKARKFKSTLRKLATIVERVMPFVKEIKPLDEKLDRPKEETERLMEQLQQAQELVNKRSEVPCWKCCCFPCFQDELQEMDEQVETSLLVTQVRTARDVAEILLIVRGIDGRQFNGLCKPPEISDPLLDRSMIKLKNQLAESSSLSDGSKKFGLWGKDNT